MIIGGTYYASDGGIIDLYIKASAIMMTLHSQTRHAGPFNYKLWLITNRLKDETYWESGVTAGEARGNQSGNHYRIDLSTLCHQYANFSFLVILGCIFTMTMGFTPYNQD